MNKHEHLVRARVAQAMARGASHAARYAMAWGEPESVIGAQWAAELLAREARKELWLALGWPEDTNP